ncbi:two pore domain potassium channel family protein [Ruegeria sediminis]|uniref:Two pore domain potassium channel family protein n=2 Tax=Ruegeria sediminis TaxID=2583820 RepID=A0ABY2X4Q8_9RHOB|nr:two pore domain potassium channel family protein [Ruegeria sediminis]
MAPSLRILMIVLAVFLVHMGEVTLYAVAYWLGGQVFGIGSFGGVPTNAPLDYFYFSVVSFTSLGIGEVFPHSHLRFLTGVEALNGLLLIAWSASFLFVAMNRLWEWQSFSVPEAGETPDRAD